MDSEVEPNVDNMEALVTCTFTISYNGNLLSNSDLYTTVPSHLQAHGCLRGGNCKWSRYPGFGDSVSCRRSHYFASL